MVPFNTGRLNALAGLFLLLLCSCSPEAGSDRFLEDRAGLLGAAERQHIARYHEKLLEDLDIRLKVTILAEPAADLDTTALELFEKYALGAGTRGARGVLLLIDPRGQQVRMEIGYDLEAIFPDGFVGHIEERQMTPFFQAGKVASGIEATVELMVGKALGANGLPSDPADKERIALDHLSGGAGARVPVAIGTEPQVKVPAADEGEFTPQATPMAALKRYLEVLRHRNKNPELSLFTPQTRDFFRQWLVTDAQQENELRHLQEGLAEAAVFTEGELAVIRFPVGDRRLPPYFLRRGPQGWMLDFAVMSRLVGFNHLNQWHFRTLDHEFAFAFADLAFDTHGFPQKTSR